MSTIHEYREQINYKLDLLRLEATALEDDLCHTCEQVMHKYEGLKISLRDSLVTVKQKLKNYQQITEAQRQNLIAKIDQVQIDLALGKADTKQKFIEQRLKIRTKIKALEQEIDQCLKQKSTTLTEHMLRAIDKLDAEFASLEIFFEMQGQKMRKNFLIDKEKLVHQLHQFNLKLAEKRELTAQKSLQFEKEFTKGWKTIKGAFLHLKSQPNK